MIDGHKIIRGLLLSISGLPLSYRVCPVQYILRQQS